MSEKYSVISSQCNFISKENYLLEFEPSNSVFV